MSYRDKFLDLFICEERYASKHDSRLKIGMHAIRFNKECILKMQK